MTQSVGTPGGTDLYEVLVRDLDDRRDLELRMQDVAAQQLEAVRQSGPQRTR